MLEVKLKQAKEELGDGSTDGVSESKNESKDIDEQPAKQMRLSTPKALGTSASDKVRVMSRWRVRSLKCFVPSILY